MNVRQPPPMEGWATECVAELNDTVDVHALSRDVPRLKILSPQRHSVRSAAASHAPDNEQLAAAAAASERQFSSAIDESDKSKQQQSQQQRQQQPNTGMLAADAAARADRMCAALLHLEELCAQHSVRDGEPPSSVAASAQTEPESSAAAPAAATAPPASPLRQTAEQRFPHFKEQPDLSDAFLGLLRASGWIPGAAAEKAASDATGRRRGMFPCDEMSPAVRVLGTFAQSVIFAPSRRMAHLLWTPFATHLTDVDWEVSLKTEPWPESPRRQPLLPKKSAAAAVSASKNKNKKKPTEATPLINDGDDRVSDSDDVDDTAVPKGRQTPVTPIHASGKNKNDDSDDSNTLHVPTQHGPDDDNTVVTPHAPPATTTTATPAAAAIEDTLYVCHKIVARNIVDKQRVGRDPRFAVMWVLELHCGRMTGVCKRAKIAGVRVRILDDEHAITGGGASCSPCACCGMAAEWMEKKQQLEEKVERAFGTQLEKHNDPDPFFVGK